MRLSSFSAAALFSVIAAIPAPAQISTNLQNWMQRINSGEFAGNAGAGGGRGAGRGGRGGGAGQWLDGGKAYRSGGMRIDTATGASTPLPEEPRYQPPGLDRPLINPTASDDGKKLLFATNSHT